jgi:hypothetical protein
VNVRPHRLAIALAGFLLGPLLSAQVTLAPQKHEDMAAQLTVEVAKETPEPGLGALTLTLSVEGPATLEVEPPHLGDAASAWKEERLASTRVVEDQRATWSQVIRLKQVKRGVEPVPDLSLRFRRGPDAPWAEAAWTDILKHTRELPAPTVDLPPERSWLGRWGFALLVGLTAVLIGIIWWRKRRVLPAPLSPEQWALGELEHLQRTQLPPQGDSETYHTQLSYVVRRYLAKRWGLHALQQTSAEFLEALRQVPHGSAEQQALLGEFLERCDLAKFAHVQVPPEECRQTTELARELVRQTATRNGEQVDGRKF